MLQCSYELTVRQIVCMCVCVCVFDWNSIMSLRQKIDKYLKITYVNKFLSTKVKKFKHKEVWRLFYVLVYTLS